MKNAELQENKSGPLSVKKRRVLFFGVFFIVVLIGIVFFLALHNTQAKKISLENEIKIREQNLVESRAFSIESWLDETVAKAKLLAGSDFFQLFASEVNQMDSIPLLFEDSSKQSTDDDLDQPASRLPLMRTQLTEFTAYANFEYARIVNTKGELYLSSDISLAPLTDQQIQLVQKVVTTAKVVFGRVVKDQTGLSFEIYLPIFPPIYEGTDGKPVSVLILSQQIGSLLTNFLKLDGVARQRALSIVQSGSYGFESIIPDGLRIRPLESITELDASLPFSLRQSTISERPVYSLGTKLRNIDWWLVAEERPEALNAVYEEYAKNIYTLVSLLTIALVLLLSAAWWWAIGREQGHINKEFRKLLLLVNQQKSLLDGINNTMDDPISLTDASGVYQYVNKAFATAIGRKEKEVIGLDTTAVFGFDTAKRLGLSDQQVLANGQRVQIQDVLWLQSKRFVFQITKTPLQSEEGKKITGVVSVFRDITRLVETQEHSRRVVQQTIDALVGTIEQADPFLGGHSRIMGAVASLIAKQLRLDDANVATIEAAANLSQIGKMSVPREILLKPGILTPEEKNIMEQHVEHTRKILDNIEFDLPVVEAIYQINERPDGQGYPRRLHDAEISVDAKVLAVANAFTAMARPRAYRPALPVEEVLSILEKQTGAYDQSIVAALKEVLQTPAGQKVAAQAATAKAI